MSRTRQLPAADRTVAFQVMTMPSPATTLTGLPDAIAATWPLAVVQTYLIHLLRTSFRYAGRQHWDAIAKTVRPVYTAPSEAAAEARFDEFAETWGQRLLDRPPRRSMGPSGAAAE
jgi:hypothetical protein